MRIIHLSLVVCVTALGILATSTPASAELICRTYYYWSGSRRCWRRVCWRTPERHYAYRPDPRPYWQDTTKNTPARSNLFDEVDDTAPSSRRAEWWDNNDDNDNSEHTTSPPHKSAGPWRAPNDARHEPVNQSTDQAAAASIALLVILLLVFIPVALLARLGAWLHEAIEHRRDLRLELKAHSARELANQLQRDAAEADALIKKYAHEAYRRGTLSIGP